MGQRLDATRTDLKTNDRRWEGFAALERFPYATTAALMAIAVAVYAGSLNGGFVYDDESQILLNPFVMNLHLWRRIFAGSVWSFQGRGMQTNFYRPLQFFCYWILYRLAGAAPSIFHLFSILLYALTVWIVYRTAVQLFGRLAAVRAEVPALAAALLWALHPLHVEVAAWISALPDLGSGLFYLLAFLLFLRAERPSEIKLRRHALAVAAYLPALFFKESALSLPLVLVAYWFFFPRRKSAMPEATAPEYDSREGGNPRADPSKRPRQILTFALYLAPVALYLMVRYRALGHFSHAAHFWRVSPQDIEAAAGLLGQHLRLFLWPAHLSAFRTFEVGPSLRTPWPWAALGMLILAFLYRRRRPLLGFAVWWWFLTLLPCLDVRQLSVPLLADRFSYLPSFGLCVAVSSLLLVELPARAGGVRAARFAVAGLAGVLLLAAGVTVRAVGNWRDEETLLNYSLKQSPSAPGLHRGRGLVLEYRYGDYDGAEREYRLAMHLNHSGLQPNLYLDYECELGLGRAAQHRGDRETGISHYQTAARLQPQLSPAYDALGVIYFPEGDYAQAAFYFERAVQANPQDLGALFYLGTCYLKLGRYGEAAAQFHAATLIDPSFRAAYDAEAHALEAAGDSTAAEAVRRTEPGK
ncbi:MAG TPA: tetratricopeptide repeat protein [Terriglobia bacterium]